MSFPLERHARPRRHLLALFSLMTGAMLLAACTSTSAPAANTSVPPTSVGSGGAATSAPAAKPTPAAAQASPAAAQSSPVAASGSPVAVRKVNANTASVPEIQQALESAGVPNAARWAREVEEYRPYPTDDLSFAKLRQNLAKYNPAPDVVEKIISALSLA
jgi:hypothetical protein